MSETTTLTGNDKIWAILCHLSIFLGVPFLLPLVVYLAKRQDSDSVAAHAREALNFHISLLIYCLGAAVLCIILIGFLLLWAIGLAGIIFSIIAAIKAADGILYRYPTTIRLIK